jgi:acetyltransferase-like isoleucine patch superfamily enzyme
MEGIALADWVDKNARYGQNFILVFPDGKEKTLKEIIDTKGYWDGMDWGRLAYVTPIITGNNNRIRVFVNDYTDFFDSFLRQRIGIEVSGSNNLIDFGKNIKSNILHVDIQMVDNNVITIGEGCTFIYWDKFKGIYTTIRIADPNSQIHIGKDCLVSANVDIWCTDTHTITDLQGNITNFGKNVEVGDHVWIGKDVKIRKNTTIPSNSVLGWGSVVGGKFDEPNVIIAGNPAKIVKRGINWDRAHLHEYVNPNI